jgi:hypothetical protein
MRSNRPQQEFLKELRERLQGGEKFMELARSFIAQAVEETRSRDKKSRFSEYYEGALNAIVEENAAQVDAASRSPIERMFLNSLILSFVKNDGLGLLIHPTFRDTIDELSEFREMLAKWRDFWGWFRKHHPNKSVHEFLDLEMQRGAMDSEEREIYTRYVFRYGYIPLDSSYHMSIQPPFRNLLGNGKIVRPDIYFWIPSKPDINIVVECDGFTHHSTKEAFDRDRRRDRAFKMLGYDVFRFSGSEIYKDPVNAPYELVQYLWHRTKKKARQGKTAMSERTTDKP